MIVEIIINDLNSALVKLGYSSIDVKISKSKNPEFGDFSCSIPLVLGKIHKKTPIDIAHQILNIFRFRSSSASNSYGKEV